MRPGTMRSTSVEQKVLAVFGVWVIEGPAGLEDKLPFKKAGVNVMVVPDVTPYKKRKVRILNGAHTGFVLGAYLAGFDIVRDCMHNDTIRGFMNKMLISSWLTKGLLKRSSTAEAKSSRSFLSSGRVGMIWK